MKDADPRPRLTAWRTFALPWNGPSGSSGSSGSSGPSGPTRLRFREGALLRWSSQPPAEGKTRDQPRRDVWTEASPLPGWSADSLAGVCQWLQARTRGEPWQISSLPAAVACSLDLARMKLRDWAGWQAPREQVPVAVLLTGSPAQWPEKAVRALRAGARIFKLKISPPTAAEVAEFLHWLKKRPEDSIRVRLDANRSFTLDQALEAARPWPRSLIAFWEEPLRDKTGWPVLLESSPVPLALDETLREIAPNDLRRFAGAAALVFKPMLMGGWEKCAPYALIGREMGMRLVISASYESGVGVADLARLAARLPGGEAAGLDTYEALSEDLLRQRLDFSGYALRVQDLPESEPAAWRPPGDSIWRESWTEAGEET